MFVFVYFVDLKLHVTFSLEKNIALKVNFKSSIRLRIDDLLSEKSQKGQKNFNEKFHVTHHFLGHFMLNSNLKSALKK